MQEGQMRNLGLGLALVLLGSGLAFAGEREDQVLGSVLSGLLGAPQPSGEATYTAQERDRLASLLGSGEYVTSRQGEMVDLMVYGIPLTRSEHVYTARPIPPSQTARPRSQP